MSQKDEKKPEQLNLPEETTEQSTAPEEKLEQTKAETKKPKRERTPEEEKIRAQKSVQRKKKLKHGTLATVLTVVFVAIVVVVNVICGVLDDRFHWNIDLTSSGLYEIDEQTISYLNQLTADVDVVMLADESYFKENSTLKIVSETLERFQAESNGHINLKYVDMTKNPEAVKTYSQNYSGGDFATGDVIIACGDLVRVAAFDDLIKQEQQIDYSTYSYVYETTFTGEQTLLSAIMGVTDLNPVKVAVIAEINGSPIYHSMDEYCFLKINELLEKNNYQVTQIDIATDVLSPEEYTAVVLCAPNTDFSDAQITKLTDYLYNDGKYERNLVYFASPYQPETPKLDDFLETWGLKFGNTVVYESDTASSQFVTSAMGMLQGVPVVNKEYTELVGSLDGSKLPIVAPLAKPIERLFEANSGRVTEALLTTSDTAYLYPLDENAEDFDVSNAETGSFTLAVLATNTYTEGADAYESAVLAFGSCWMLDHYVASTSSYQNAEYFITSLNSLTGKENTITIAEKSLDQTAITISDAQKNAIRMVTVFVIPLTIAALGVVVFIRRRNQ